MNIDWQLKKFSELSPYEVYAIMQLRMEVFVVEQNCVYQDADDNDLLVYHFMGKVNEKLVAYTRLLPAGVMYKEVSIGRVITSPSVRRTGAGKELMKRSIEKVYELFGLVPIKIAAQLYLQNFYESFGFQRISDVFLEDGIDHIYMMKT